MVGYCGWSGPLGPRSLRPPPPQEKLIFLFSNPPLACFSQLIHSLRFSIALPLAVAVGFGAIMALRNYFRSVEAKEMRGGRAERHN